jgi:hypothetical protein
MSEEIKVMGEKFLQMFCNEPSQPANVTWFFIILLFTRGDIGLFGHFEDFKYLFLDVLKKLEIVPISPIITSTVFTLRIISSNIQPRYRNARFCNMGMT